MKRQRLLIGILIAGLALAVGPGSFAAQDPGPEEPLAPTMFDGDSFADLAIGVPWEDVDGEAAAGAVNILYGGPARGLSALDNRTLTQDVSGMLDAAEQDDRFGYSLAVGDFDGDGYVDLAVGIGHEDISATSDAGAVHIIYGSATGLGVTDDQFLYQSAGSIEDNSETDDEFGHDVAAGDFDGDGCDDLAVGVPYEDIGSPVIADSGAVAVLYGSVGGLGGDDELWHQDVSGVEGGAEAGDNFGYAVAAGDFDGDGYDDLAVGVPYEDIDAGSNAGAVNILYGSPSGLTASGDQVWHQNQSAIEDAAESGDAFGYELVAGDFNGNGRDDLAVGVPYEDIGAVADAGAVQVLYGASSGLASSGDQLWHQDVSGVEGAAEKGDRFGLALTAGDFNGDGRHDLAVGVPLEAVGSATGAGAVNVLAGSGGGLTATGSSLWHQDITGISDSPDADDQFGRSLAAGDFDGDGAADLAVGVPYEDIGSPAIADAGAVHVLAGSPKGLAVAGGDQFWHQDKTDVADKAETGDRFGFALAAVPQTARVAYLPLLLHK